MKLNTKSKNFYYTQADFDWVFWQPKDIKKITFSAIKQKKEDYAKIKKTKLEDRNFNTIIIALDKSNFEISKKINLISLLFQVSPDKKIREEAKKSIDVLNEAMLDIEYDKGIYQAVRDCASKKEKLDAPSSKLLKETLRDYKKMGFDLSESKFFELREKNKKLKLLESEFEKNINDHKDHIEVSLAELDGLSKNFIDSLVKNKNGKFLVSLDYPEIGPFIANASNALKRKELIEKNFQKGGLKNIKILEEIIKVRQEIARILGYKSHACLVIEDKMAKTPETVYLFLKNLISKLQKGVILEKKELSLFKKEMIGDPKLNFFDYAFYSNQLKKQKFNIDNEKIREYFPIEKVKMGTLEIYSKLFSLTFKKNTKIKLWHQDIELYEVFCDKNGLLGYFALDLYPREGKYGHACASDIFMEHLIDGIFTPTFAVMITNFAKPNAKNPSLLSHGEVDTFFHEFGHIMHEVLSRSKYFSQAGTSVSRDFVELPSQMFENWVWDEKMLKKLSSHYQTGENIPKKTVQQMIKAKNHMVALSTIRQCVLALYDLEIHSGKNIKNLNFVYKKMNDQFNGQEIPPNQIFPAGFGHLAGYDAGYYGYMWSLVYACDAFSIFKKNGLLNPKIGMKFRKEILEKGSSLDEMIMLKNFLGRKPNDKAFLVELGLSKK